MHSLPLVLLVAGLTAAEPADDRRLIDQPIQELVRTELVYAQEPRELQVTVRSLLDRQHGGHTWEFPLALEYGLSEAWQVEVEWDALTRARTDAGATTGTGALAVGTKYSFMQIGGRPLHAALGVDVQVPGIADAGAGFEPSAALAFDAPAGLFLVGQAAASFGDEEDDREIEAEASGPGVDLNFAAFRRVGAVVAALELTMSAERWGQPFSTDLVPSVTVRAPWNAEIGVGVPIALNRGVPRLGFAVQIALER